MERFLDMIKREEREKLKDVCSFDKIVFRDILSGWEMDHDGVFGCCG